MKIISKCFKKCSWNYKIWEIKRGMLDEPYIVALLSEDLPLTGVCRILTRHGASWRSDWEKRSQRRLKRAVCPAKICVREKEGNRDIWREVLTWRYQGQSHNYATWDSGVIVWKISLWLTKQEPKVFVPFQFHAYKLFSSSKIKAELGPESWVRCFSSLSLHFSVFANLPPLMEYELLKAPHPVPGAWQEKWVNASTSICNG